MSATAVPISLERFALAIVDLPLANLHFKASELRNSIAHLLSSNEQLQPYAEEGDRDCADAIRENEEVVVRLRERIALLRREVEWRGHRWDDAEVEDKGDLGEDAQASGGGVLGHEVASVNGAPERRAVNGGGRGGSLTDEELEWRLREQMEQNEEGDGLHI